MGLIEKLQEIKTKLENYSPGTGGETEAWEITNCNSLFREGSRLDIKDILLNKIASNTEDLSYMFYSCTNLEEIDLSNLNLNNVTTMTYMFQNCRKAIKIDLSNVNTSKVETFRYMFNKCAVLEELNFKICLDGIYTYTATKGLFDNCSCLKKIDFTGTTYILDGVEIDVSSTALDHDGIISMLESLPITENSVTITLGTEKLALLTDMEIAMYATTRGYTLA